MTSTTERPASAAFTAFGLSRPGPTDIKRSLDRIFGEESEAEWASLCDEAQVPRHHLDEEACTRLLDTMHAHADGAIRLCAESFLIRANTFAHLFSADQIVRNSA